MRFTATVIIVGHPPSPGLRSRGGEGGRRSDERVPAFNARTESSCFKCPRDAGATSVYFAITGVSVTGPSRPQSVNGQFEASKGL